VAEVTGLWSAASHSQSLANCPLLEFVTVTAKPQHPGGIATHETELYGWTGDE